MVARKKAARKKATTRKRARKAVSKATGKPTAKKAVAKKPVKKAAASKARAPGEKTARGKPKRRKALHGGAHIAAKRGGPSDPALLGELEALASMMDAHGLVEVSYELDSDGSKRIHVSRQTHALVTHAAPVPAAPAAAAAGDEPPAAAAPAADENLVPFASPMVGTFYRAPSPEAAPFVSVGDNIDPSAVVCIIEAMKVMNEVNPEVSGEVVSIEVENGEAVEFGQTLMLVRPR